MRERRFFVSLVACSCVLLLFVAARAPLASAEPFTLEDMRLFFALSVRIQHFGAGDAPDLFPLVRDLYDPSEGAFFTDFGAHVGTQCVRCSGIAMLEDFAGLKDGVATHPVPVLFVEPMPLNYAQLHETALSRNWVGAGALLVNAAVSNFTGASVIYTSGVAGDYLGSVGTRSLQAGNVEEPIKVYKIDDLLRELNLFHRPCFFMKLDCEGTDPLALQGASEFLKQRTTRFLVFEYNEMWSDMSSHTIQSVAAEMYGKYDMKCFFMFPRLLVPLYGAWWTPELEIRRWSNVFCMRSEDSQFYEIWRKWSSALSHHAAVVERFIELDRENSSAPYVR